jgi:hypothetical protein
LNLGKLLNKRASWFGRLFVFAAFALWVGALYSDIFFKPNAHALGRQAPRAASDFVAVTAILV